MAASTKEYQLWVNYGHGWEHEVSEETLQEIRDRYQEYRVNCPEYPAKIKVKNISGE